MEDFRIQVLEMWRKYEVLMERLQVYEKLVADVAALNGRLDSISSGISAMVKADANTSGRHSDISQEIRKDHSLLEHKLDSHISSVANEHNQHKLSIRNICSDYQNVNVYADKINKKLDDHMQRSASKDDLQKFKQYSEQNHLALSDLVDSYISSSQRIKEELHNQSSVQVDLVSSSAMLRAKISDLSGDLQKTKGSFKDNLDGISSSIPRQVEDCVKRCDSKLQDMQKVIDAIPPLKEVRDDLTLQLSLIAMESRNATLKLSNLENQFKFLDKKMEYVDLRVNKLELPQ